VSSLRSSRPRAERPAILELQPSILVLGLRAGTGGATFPLVRTRPRPGCAELSQMRLPRGAEARRVGGLVSQVEVPCTECGAVSLAEVAWSFGVSSVAREPAFGLRLHLQRACCGRVLWACNPPGLPGRSDPRASAESQRDAREPSSRLDQGGGQPPARPQSDRRARGRDRDRVVWAPGTATLGSRLRTSRRTARASSSRCTGRERSSTP